MKKKNHTLYVTNYPLLFKSFLIGALLAELFFLVEVVSKIFVGLSTFKQKESWLWVIVVSYSLIIVSCFFRKNFWRTMWILIKSLRLDLLIISFSGAFLVFTFGGFGVEFFRGWVRGWIGTLSMFQLIVLISLPVIIFISLILRKLQPRFLTKKDQDSLFMSDKEGKSKNDDEFDFLDKAERFAERVFNQGSSESLVFGIDAPWGTGKSTFVNLCKEYWSENHKNEMIIYTFDPLRYENKEKLLKKFIDGLIKEIRNHVFAPEIESLVSKYAKLLKDSKASFSFFGLSFGLPLWSESMDDVFERMETALLYIDKKIVIIVDDLDRLNFSAIKEVLFVIKKAFTLPNISYVLCYDTENISALEHKNLDTEKISEFLEKFINVKTSLYLDNKLLLEYFTENKDKSLSKNLLANTELVSKAVEGIKDIFKSRDFHYYLPFIGDARKLKRLINTILLLEIEKTDFDNCDFDKQDLIHLLLIYINYPNIFRKIYNTETQGKKGFFSVVTKYEDGYPKSNNHQPHEENIYKNSVEYSNYLGSLFSENQKFILNKVFDVNQRLVDDRRNVLKIDSITKEMSTSYACFNGSNWGSGGRNLEEYLNLITKMSRPINTEQYKFYVNSKNSILTDKTIEEVLAGEKFSFSESESTHQQLWRVLVNSSYEEFTPEKSKEVICYALNSLPQYSLIEIVSIGVGFRDDLTLFIAKLLDEVGWVDEEWKHINNTDDNVAEIAKWIFGEGDHEEEGVLDILGKEDRGVMGLYDLLLFRLWCCADRGGDMYNLSRSLSKHGNFQAPTSGNTEIIVVEEMREISQKIFKIFKSQYIDQRKNIFDEIDNLTMEDVCGKYLNFINTKVKSVDIKDIEAKLSILKSKMKSFIVYQLGNTIIYHGIGCGYYDVSENKDEKDISKAINNYIFGYCFSPKKNENNYRHFLDYLLSHFSHTIGNSGSSKYIPHINEFTKALDKERLTDYWQDHSVAIKPHNYENEDRKVITGNYVASYAEDLRSTYNVLDELIKSHEVSIITMNT